MKAAEQKFVAAGHKALAVRCDVSDDAQVAATWIALSPSSADGPNKMP